MESLWAAEKVLALSPHTDDLEFAAGGLVIRLLAAGASVESVAFSPAKESIPAGLSPDTLAKEFRAASDVLGIPPEQVHVLDFPVRNFPSLRQPLLDEMIRLRARFKPDLVLVPCSGDLHQDHRTIHEESVRAFKHTTILGYEMPWNLLHSRAQLFVELGPGQLERKIEAVAAYRSQGFRPYAAPDFIRAWARTRGISINAPAAEAFEVVRWVWGAQVPLSEAASVT